MNGTSEFYIKYVSIPRGRYTELLEDSIKLDLVRKFLNGDSCVTFKELTEMILSEKEDPEC